MSRKRTTVLSLHRNLDVCIEQRIFNAAVFCLLSHCAYLSWNARGPESIEIGSLFINWVQETEKDSECVDCLKTVSQSNVFSKGEHSVAMSTVSREIVHIHEGCGGNGNVPQQGDILLNHPPDALHG